jgi:hypothetical protein
MTAPTSSWGPPPRYIWCLLLKMLFFWIRNTRPSPNDLVWLRGLNTRPSHLTMAWVPELSCRFPISLLIIIRVARPASAPRPIREERPNPKAKGPTFGLPHQKLRQDLTPGPQDYSYCCGGKIQVLGTVMPSLLSYIHHDYTWCLHGHFRWTEVMMFLRSYSTYSLLFKALNEAHLFRALLWIQSSFLCLYLQGHAARLVIPTQAPQWKGASPCSTERSLLSLQGLQVQCSLNVAIRGFSSDTSV